MKRIMRAVVLAGLATSGAFSLAQAADSDGNYALRGAGNFSCERYRASVEADDPTELNQFLSWVQGHITATNRMSDDTFDLYPILSPTRIGAMLYNVCGNYPESRLEEAAVSLGEYMAPGRVREASEIAQVSSGEGTMALRRDTLAKVQESLIEAGHYEGDPGALFDERMQAALRRYQQANNLPTTGLPDADTLMALFY